ncbi:hypothetical protein SSX86_032702 [Deinandra increscens subsp. villosa]|uniref:Cathepsin propeptide inhibitor domain-containing protein n=1 Tax=Deinandra increscens subsp. villosa TaxID=3103831 RepID=A0AAP0C6R3_9ASTR
MSSKTSLALLFFLASLLSHAASRLLSENSSYESHEQWMGRYGRNYKDAEEKELCSQIYQQNVQYIESFNNVMNKGYKLAVNEFTDLTNEEFRTARNIFKAHECSPSTNSAFRFENVTAVPSSVDWRKKGAVTPIKDQGQCASEYPSSFFNRSLIGEALDGGVLCSVKLLLNEGGGADFDVVYVGGLHVFLVFNQPEAADVFLKEKKQWWTKYFNSLDIWKGQAVPRLRIVGLRILGVPLHLRDDLTYDAIAKEFGKIIWPSQSSWMLGDCSRGLVHVLSDAWKASDETALIVWKDANYTVMIKEEAIPWNPTFVEEEVVTNPAVSPAIGKDGGVSDDWEEDEEWDDRFSQESAQAED